MFSNVGMHVRYVPHGQKRHAARLILRTGPGVGLVGEAVVVGDGGQTHFDAYQKILGKEQMLVDGFTGYDTSTCNLVDRLNPSSGLSGPDTMIPK